MSHPPAGISFEAAERELAAFFVIGLTMKVFHCDHCRGLIFFENSVCVNCRHTLAYVPDLSVVASLDPAGGDRWTSRIERARGQSYRLCQNYYNRNVCNWAVRADDPNPFCQSCRLTRTIPNLSDPTNATLWYKLEVAKRRLLYTLQQLHLPLASKSDDRMAGLAFHFLEESPGRPVRTGHEDGVITMNIAEADEVERERRRVSLHEPYRTLLGHFRHEIGHYYWDRLIDHTPRLMAFRELFGDERIDYAQSLKRHYSQGPSAGWMNSHVSAYATAHAWEDWAETWAHYLHVTDTLETAAGCGIRLHPSRDDEPALDAVANPIDDANVSFDRMMSAWGPLTYVLNNLNRGLGMADAYPFVLSEPVMKKLRFVHETIELAHRGAKPPGNETTDAHHVPQAPMPTVG